MRFKETIKFAVLLAVALGAAPAYSAFWQWSKTATNNATADPSINWSEGMSPSSVNDSARAQMAREAEQRDDISGLLTTAGGPTAFTVTTNQGLQTPTPVDGQMISVTMNATNGAGATLSADAGTAYPIQTAPGVGAPAGALVSGSPYTLKFSLANSAWMLRNFYGQTLAVPLGGLVPYTLTTVPNSNFVFPAGQCISTTTYATYWTALGSPAPGGCGAGTFAVLDLRGRVPAALDTLPGFAAGGRLTTSATGCGTAMTTVGATCLGTESFTIANGNLPANIPYSDPTHSHSVTIGSGSPYLIASPTGGAVNIGGTGSGGTLSSGSYTTSASGVGITINSGGANTAISRVQPTIGVTYLLRVL